MLATQKSMCCLAILMPGSHTADEGLPSSLCISEHSPALLSSVQYKLKGTEDETSHCQCWAGGGWEGAEAGKLNLKIRYRAGEIAQRVTALSPSPRSWPQSQFCGGERTDSRVLSSDLHTCVSACTGPRTLNKN